MPLDQHVLFRALALAGPHLEDAIERLDVSGHPSFLALSLALSLRLSRSLRVYGVQGYLAHKEQRPPRTLQ